MSHTVTLIPGDSLGDELVPVVERVMEAVGVDIHWEVAAAGRKAYEATGDPLPPETLELIRKNKVALKGRIRTPLQTGYRSPDHRLHKALDLYAAKRRIQNLPGLPSRHQGLNLVITHECTEDVNVGLEHELLPGVVQSIKITTRDACLRIARYAFEFAKRHGRRRVTLVHKANIMKRSDGLFIRCGQEVAAHYPDITLETIIADNACMQMVSRPGQFDVVLAQNLFGEILSSIGAGVVGGISAVWGELAGDEGIRVYEVLHGFAPQLAGRGIANPLPFLMPTVAMLRHLREMEASDRLRRAISATLSAGIMSPDLGGDADTQTFASAIIERLD
jgi:isocitrate dehydrogenase (NAD+)